MVALSGFVKNNWPVQRGKWEHNGGRKNVTKALYRAIKDKHAIIAP